MPVLQLRLKTIMLAIAVVAVALAVMPGAVILLTLTLVSGILVHVINRFFGPMRYHTLVILWIIAGTTIACVLGFLLGSIPAHHAPR